MKSVSLSSQKNAEINYILAIFAPQPYYIGNKQLMTSEKNQSSPAI